MIKIHEFAVICILASPFNAYAEEIKDPETEIASALTELDTLASRIETASQIYMRQGLGPQKIAADRAFKNALNFYRHQEWQSVIRETNNYLNLSQVPNDLEYLQAQYMLGRSYQETRLDARALRAYFRYIAAYMTQSKRDEDEFIDVLRRMIPLATKDSNAISELRKLLSSITTLNIPDAIRPEVLFLAAKTAAKEGNRKLAETWLQQTISMTGDVTLKAKALYIKALIAISINDLALAEDLLTEVIQVDTGENTSEGYNNRDLARLALARIAIRRKKYDTAQKLYEVIPEESSAYKDALFESIYIHAGRHQEEKARSKALIFIARFPDSQESTQLRSLLAYLDLRAGDIDAAQASIKAADKQLDQIAKWMRANFSGVTAVDQSKLTDFIAISSPQMKTSPTIDSARKLFDRIAEITRRLADIDGEMRDLVYTIGRANIDHLKPRWTNRTDQLATLAEEAISISHRLAAVERNLYNDRIPPVETQQLNASEERRTKLLTPAASSKREAHYWHGLAKLFDLTSEIAIEYRKLSAVRAEISAAKYLIDISKKSDVDPARVRRLDDLEIQLTRASTAARSVLSRLRKAKIEHLIKQSPHHAARKFIAQYATALQEESGVLQAFRGSPRNISERLLAEDAARAWKRWHFVVDLLFKQIEALDAEIRLSIEQTIRDLDDHENVHQKLSERLSEARTLLENQLGQSISTIVDQYTFQIDDRQSRHQKWTAGADWLRYQASERTAKNLEEKFNLETQVLRDNLSDLEQGVLWQWPE